MNLNFVIRGLLSAAIIFGIHKSMKNIVRLAVGMVFFAIWNATYHGELHLVLALIGFICSPIGMLIISIAFWKEDRLKSLATPALIISILAVLAFLYLGLRGVHTPTLELTKGHA
jgi:hypothetical membrane protein